MLDFSNIKQISAIFQMIQGFFANMPFNGLLNVFVTNAQSKL